MLLLYILYTSYFIFQNGIVKQYIIPFNIHKPIRRDAKNLLSIITIGLM